VPTIPIGLDAYREWQRLPYHRIGVRAYMRSTYDRSGGNEAADASHFVRQEAEDRNVTLDTAGPGILYFVRTNHWHGSPWHYRIDGVEHVVSESSTADPNNPVENSVFLPEALFPNPLTWTWSITRGADLNWVPMPFERSLSLAYGRTHYGTGYYIYHSFPEGADNLSQPLSAWDGMTPPDDDVLDLLRSAGSDIAPRGDDVSVHDGRVDVAPGEEVLVTELGGGPSMLRALKLTAPRDRAVALGRAWLRVRWDDRVAPSIDAPIGYFFGSGSLYNRSGGEYLVRGLLASVRFDDERVRLAMYYPMPFHASARVTIVGGDEPIADVEWQLRTEPYRDPPNWVGYFHATYKDHAEPEPGKDLVLLDTREAEGGGDFCGSFVGMSWSFSDAAVFSTLEGDPRFFFDDSASPQAYGTGTEEWAGGGDYWGGQTMTLPLAGHPAGAPSIDQAHHAEDAIQTAYRFLLADLMPFGKNARIQLEHGGHNESTERYRSVVYWYGAPGACLRLTDSFHVGDPIDEGIHRYLSPTASAVDTLTSRYEWGVDQLGAIAVLPESTDTGRHMTGTTEFSMRIEPDNFGVLLRRKLDYGYPDQTAEVSIAADEEGAPFEHAGTWRLSGSNRCVYSNPPEELGAAEQVLQASNRRWREDEFLVPRRLTRGRDAIRIRIEHKPQALPLVPNLPVDQQAFSEFRYWAYVWVLPTG
jgi:hypothetical protein